MGSLSAKRLATIDRVDRMPAELRQCVHEYGYPIVSALVQHGVTNAAAIHHIVMEIWMGARQEAQRANAAGSLDSLLGRCIFSERALRRYLSQTHLVIVSVEPTRAMLDASMEEVSGHNVRCTREEKHRRRLRAALRTQLPPLDAMGGGG